MYKAAAFGYNSVIKSKYKDRQRQMLNIYFGDMPQNYIECGEYFSWELFLQLFLLERQKIATCSIRKEN